MGYKYIHDQRHVKRYKLVIFLIGLMMVFGGVLAVTQGLGHSPAHQVTTAIAATKPAVAHKVDINYGLPVRLQIPKLQIDTHIIYVGLSKDGNMSVPDNVIDAGWYKYGALPGNIGTAVLAGHLDGLRGEPGVFSNLSKLAIGDIVKVTESNGLTVSFAVREMKSYLQTEQPDEVFNSTSGSHLNLITCTGSWDSSEHQFAKRLVVFADKTS